MCIRGNIFTAAVWSLFLLSLLLFFCCRIFCCRHKYCIIIFVLFRFSFRYVTWKISCRGIFNRKRRQFSSCLVWFQFFCYFEYRKSKSKQNARAATLTTTIVTTTKCLTNLAHKISFACLSLCFHRCRSRHYNADEPRVDKVAREERDRGESEGRGDMLSYNTRPKTRTHTQTHAHTTLHPVVPACPTSSAHKCLLVVVVK